MINAFSFLKLLSAAMGRQRCQTWAGSGVSHGQAAVSAMGRERCEARLKACPAEHSLELLTLPAPTRVGVPVSSCGKLTFCSSLDGPLQT